MRFSRSHNGRAGFRRLCAAALFLGGPAAAYETTPYFSASLMGGQYFYGEKEGALAGNGSVLAAAAMKFSPDFTLVPLYNGSYQGSKQVLDLTGGGTLFQALMDHKASVKGVYSVSRSFRLKPEVSIKREYLKETRDEAWGRGLFDYIRPGASLEAEYQYSAPFTVRAGYDLYKLRFYNYSSLESQVGAAEGSMARETAGPHTLDSMNNNFYLAGDFRLPWNSLGEAAAAVTLRAYPDQNLVDQAGQYEAGTRKDTAITGSFGWRFPRKLSGGRLLTPGFSLAWAQNYSNQNSYDAQHVQFIKDYYDYTRPSVGAAVSLRGPLAGKDKCWDAMLGLNWARTDYRKRPVQDDSGLYTRSKIRIDEATAVGALAYDIAKGFKAKVSLQYGRQTSNMDYEKLYKYSFAVFSYLAGVTYEY